MEKIIEEKIQEYKTRAKKEKGGIRSLKWNSYLSATRRYKQLTQDINFENKTILDVGCGFGDIIPYINATTENLNYTGIDMIDDFIFEAQKRYPDFGFKLGDYFANPLAEKFDIILCSGALNSNLPQALEYRQKAIKTMFKNTNYVLGFNMAGNFPPPENKKESEIFYANSLEILKFCLQLTPKVILRHHYHHRDFTIILWRT